MNYFDIISDKYVVPDEYATMSILQLCEGLLIFSCKKSYYSAQTREREVLKYEYYRLPNKSIIRVTFDYTKSTDTWKLVKYKTLEDIGEVVDEAWRAGITIKVFNDE